MKKVLLLTLAAMISFAASAQTCSYTVNEYDPFLKIKKVQTEEILVYNWYKKLSISFANFGGDKYLVAQLSLLEPALFTHGDKAILLMEDGETITLDLLSENGKLASFGDSFTAAGITAHTFKLLYPITDVDALKNKQLMAVRIYNSGSYVEFPRGRTAKELGGLGKDKKLKKLEAIFSEENLQCINI